MKDVFNQNNIRLTAQHIHRHFHDFKQNDFIEKASDELENRELKERSNQICIALIEFLPDDYLTALDILLASLQPVINNQDLTKITTDNTGVAGWMIMPYSDFVARQGQGFLMQSLDALRVMTQLFTSEFGIRSFIIEQRQATLDILTNWTRHECHHVRRLVSEGTRPLLPWAIQLPEIKADPSLTLPLLEQLKNDDSEYVRRSVANHLNDIAKDHPDFVANVVKSWMEADNIRRYRMLKHACRTLIKQGHAKTLNIFGYDQPKQIELGLKITPSLNLGDNLVLTLELTNLSDQSQNLLVDFVIYHKKANGKLAPKVFKWKELKLDAGQTEQLHKKHAMRAITTRKYYSGVHKVAVQLNGHELIADSFTLDC